MPESSVFGIVRATVVASPQVLQWICFVYVRFWVCVSIHCYLRSYGQRLRTVRFAYGLPGGSRLNAARSRLGQRRSHGHRTQAKTRAGPKGPAPLKRCGELPNT